MRIGSGQRSFLTMFIFNLIRHIIWCWGRYSSMCSAGFLTIINLVVLCPVLVITGFIRSILSFHYGWWRRIGVLLIKSSSHTDVVGAPFWPVVLFIWLGQFCLIIQVDETSSTGFVQFWYGCPVCFNDGILQIQVVGMVVVQVVVERSLGDSSQPFPWWWSKQNFNQFCLFGSSKVVFANVWDCFSFTQVMGFFALILLWVHLL